MNRGNYIACAVALCVPVLGIADETQTKSDGATKVEAPQAPEKKQDGKKQTKRTPAELEKAKADLIQRKDEAKALMARATTVTKAMGELASSGKLPQDEDSIKLMKQMVDEMGQIRERLTKIDEEIQGILGWIEGQNEALPVLTQSVSDLQKTKLSGYVQFQYRDTDQKGGQYDSFRLRRTRLTLQHQIDPRTGLRVSYDFSTSNFGTPNAPTDTVGQLKDAYLIYDIVPSDVKVGTVLWAGQQNMPLGYEIERSSSEREFPERAQYNQTYFSGERGRGVLLRHGVSDTVVAQVGLFNAMTYNDPEQRTFQGSPANRLGVMAGLRYATKNIDLGVTGFQTERPEVQVGFNGGTATKVFAPKIDRQFVYVDAAYVGFLDPKLTLRGEAMVGKDRTPLTPNSTSSGTSNSGISDPNDIRLKQKDVSGYHMMLSYNFDARNQLNLRYEAWDPDKSTGGNFFRGYGVSYLYYINPNARLMLAHEIFEDDARTSVSQTRYGVTTLRLQFKF